MRRPLPHLLVLALLVAGCGIDEGVVARKAAEAPPAVPDPTTTGPAEAPGPAAPFTVGDVPDGYEPVVEGTGEDEAGDAVPVTVLAPDGEPVGAGVVFVEPAPEGEGDAFDAATDDEPWARLVEGDVQVWGVDATADELGEVAAAADPPVVAGAPPTVPDPPAGLEVVGAITVDGAVALAAGGPGDEDGPVPGPPSAQVAAWRCADGCDGSLVVMALPVGSLDPATVVTESRAPRRTTDEPRDSVVVEEVGPVEDVTWRGVVVDTADPGTGTGAIVRRTVAVETDRGVLVLVARGPDLLDADALVEVAESVALA